MSKFWKKIFTSKYTGKQIDEAVGKVLDGDVGMTNPMTAAGDIIIGGTDGEPEKLAKGTDGKVLKMVSGVPAWADDAGGMENPMTAAGDLIVGGEAGAAGRLAKGTDGQVLSMVSGAPAWAAAQGGGHLYEHHFIYNHAESTYAVALSFKITNTSADAIPTGQTLKDVILNAFGTSKFAVAGNYYFGGPGNTATSAAWMSLICAKYDTEASTTLNIIGSKMAGITSINISSIGDALASDLIINTFQIF